MVLTEAQYHAEAYDYAGYCTSCKQLSYGHEPDARRQECELCGENRVYGLEEAVMMGLVSVIQ